VSARSNGNTQYRVKELDDEAKKRWDAFVLSCNEATFFHLSGWKTVIENSLRHPTRYLFCERGEEIVGVLPLAQVKSWFFGDALVSLPFLAYGGVVATDAHAETLLIESACRYAKDLRVDYLEIRNQRVSGRDWPVNSKYVTFSKRIDKDSTALLAEIPRKQRAMVRKGISAGLEAVIENDTENLYRSMLACKRNLGTPFFDRSYFDDILETFGDSVEILSVRMARETVCSVMSFRFRNEILPYYGGGGVLARDNKGNDFMYWSVMERASRNGIEIFDYGRSMIGSGAYRFKKHWGFDPAPLFYEYFMVGGKDVPNLNPSNPRYRPMILAWKRLPLRVAAQLGPPIARRIA
jgi:FemAB-related protein (PEP-CTERM system-associated)